MPDAEDFKIVKDFKGDTTVLPTAERFVVAMSSIDFVRERLAVFAFKVRVSALF